VTHDVPLRKVASNEILKITSNGSMRNSTTMMDSATK
jgi:hypothetical protein